MFNAFKLTACALLLFQVYLKAPMILNGVCVIWKGWIDLQRLDGMGCLEFDEERAQVRQHAWAALPQIFLLLEDNVQSGSNHTW